MDKLSPKTDSSDDDLLKLTLRTKKPSPSTPAAAKKPQFISKPQEPQPTSSFESGSDSESAPDGPNPTISSTPNQKSTNGAGKSRSKPSAPDPVTQSKSVAQKRRADDKETDAKDAKKSKKNAKPETSDKKPTDDPKITLNHRVWCEEDEIAILKGVIDYSATKKVDPFSDLNDFYDFIKKDLQKDFSKSQVNEKVRRLNTKYENNIIKANSCKEMTFTKPHEQKVYELSKSAWEKKNAKAYGVVKVSGGVVKVSGSSKPNDISLRKAATKMNLVADKEESKGVAAVDAETESVLPAKRVKPLGQTVEERILTIGTEMFENGKGEAGEKEWNNLRIDEMQVYLNYLEVKSAQARLVIERLKSGGK